MKILPFYLERLKLQVLQQAGITTVSPGNCKQLAALIQSNLHIPISDTTLKRIFGFAAAKHGISLFTVNALAQYCGYQSWDNFCDQCGRGAAASDQMISMSRWTQKISRRSLEALINSSGIPYPLTVKRSFIDDQLDLFAEGTQNATVLAAPAGYGKTIGLCHWVEKQLDAMMSGDNQDTLLFLSSKLLPGLQQSGLRIDDWLRTLMGFGPESPELSAKLEERLQGPGFFYLVIDGFDPEHFAPAEFERLSGLLLSILDLYRHQASFKLILTMRSASWLILYKKLQAGKGFANWDLGFMQDNGTEVNVPLFGAEEIQALCRQLRPAAPAPPLTLEAIALFRYPLFFQYYYQKHPLDFNTAKLDALGIYELVSSYFLEKIYHSRLAAEKIRLLHSLLTQASLHQGNFSARKLTVLEELKKFGQAYNELVSLGFLREVNVSREGAYAEYIEFPHKRLLAYSLAGKLVYENDELYNEALAGKVSALPEDLRVPVLKWCIFNALKVGQFTFFNCLEAIPLAPTNKVIVIVFLGDLLKHQSVLTQETGLLAAAIGRQPDLIVYCLGPAYLSRDYGPALEGCLSLQPAAISKAWVYTALAMNHLVLFNSVGVEKCLHELRQLPAEVFSSLPLSPLDCLETIYSYLKYGTVRKGALKQITAYYFNPIAEPQLQRPEHQLLFVLALHTLKICDQPLKQLRLIKVLENDLAGVAYPGFSFLLSILKAEAQLAAGKPEEAGTLYQALADAAEADRKTCTPFMKTRLDLLQLRLLVASNRQAEAQQALEYLISATEKTGYYYMQTEAIASYLDRYPAYNSPDHLKRIHYQFIRTIRRSGFNPQSFPFYGGMPAWTPVAV